jgi:hypothetical protein
MQSVWAIFRLPGDGAPDQGTVFATVRDFPELQLAALDFRSQHAVIRTKAAAQKSLTRLAKELFARMRVPQAQGSVPTGTGQQIAGMVEGNSEAPMCVSFQHPSWLPRGHIPQVDFPIDAFYRQRVAVRVPGEIAIVRPDGLLHLGEELSRIQVEHLDHFPADNC